MRWLLLDEVVFVERKIAARCRGRVPESVFSAELLMMEMMAQTGALLLGAEKDFSEDLVFAKIAEAEFETGCRPGEPLEIEARSEILRSEGAWFEAGIESSNKKIARSRFLLLSVGHLIPGNAKPITFHDAFMKHFKIREKVR